MTEVFEVPESFSPPLHRALGIRMGFGADGEGVAWVDIDPEVHYGNRWAHGGLAATLADVASGIAIGRQLGASAMQVIEGTIDLKINFIRKVHDGDMTAKARVLHLGKRMAVTDVVITSKGALCAKALATFMLRRE